MNSFTVKTAAWATAIVLACSPASGAGTEIRMGLTDPVGSTASYRAVNEAQEAG